MVQVDDARGGGVGGTIDAAPVSGCPWLRRRFWYLRYPRLGPSMVSSGVFSFLLSAAGQGCTCVPNVDHLLVLCLSLDGFILPARARDAWEGAFGAGFLSLSRG